MKEFIFLVQTALLKLRIGEGGEVSFYFSKLSDKWIRLDENIRKEKFIAKTRGSNVKYQELIRLMRIYKENFKKMKEQEFNEYVINDFKKQGAIFKKMRVINDPTLGTI